MIKNILVRHNFSKGGNKRISFSLKVGIAIFIFFSFASISFAYTEVYFQKEVGEVKKGDTFIANLKISSGETINAIDGVITYDKDKIEVEKVSIENSLLSLWIKEPTFDNKLGELSFVGGVPNGFKDKDGQILAITFLAKKEGTNLIGFKDIFSVYLNDGLGTSINPWLKPMSLSVNNRGTNYLYYMGGFILIFLSVIIILVKFKNKKNDK